jgi:hypothetical protein
LRRRAARGCVAAALVSLVLAGVGSAAAQEEAPALPDVFRASASSQVLSAFLDRDALLPVNDAFRFIALDGQGTYESSNQTARASLFYPGNGVISGPSLACGTFGAQAPPEFGPLLEACAQYQYPLTVFADSLNPQGSTTGSLELGEPSDPASARAVRAVARAGLEGSMSDAAMTDLQVLGFPAAGPLDTPLPLPGAPELDATVISIDSAQSLTDERIDDAGRLVVRSEAILDGVRLLGGLIEIGSIRSSSTVVDDGKGTKERGATLDVSDVTVGGVPAQITEDGLVVGSPTGADGPLVQRLSGALNDLLGGLGVQVTTLAVEDGEEESGVAFARSGGVLVEFDVDAQGAPILPGPQGDVDPNGLYKGVITLGQTGATGLAAHIEDPPFVPGGGPTAPDVPAVDIGAGGAGSGAPLNAGFDDLAGDAGDAELGAPTGPAAPGQRIVSLSEALAAGRVELVYLAFTLMTLAVCLGPRFVLPARLPGSAP